MTRVDTAGRLKVDVKSSFFSQVHSGKGPGSGGNSCRWQLVRVSSLVLLVWPCAAAATFGPWCITQHLHQFSCSHENERACKTGWKVKHNNRLLYWADQRPKSEAPGAWQRTAPVLSDTPNLKTTDVSDETLHVVYASDCAIQRRYRHKPTDTSELVKWFRFTSCRSNTYIPSRLDGIPAMGIYWRWMVLSHPFMADKYICEAWHRVWMSLIGRWE